MKIKDLKLELEKYDDDTLVLASRNIDENEVEWLEITDFFDVSALNPFIKLHHVRVIRVDPMTEVVIVYWH